MAKPYNGNVYFDLTYAVCEYSVWRWSFYAPPYIHKHMENDLSKKAQNYIKFVGREIRHESSKQPVLLCYN